MTLEDFLARLERVRKTAAGSEARCPAHDDRRASLSVSEGKDGRVLVFCHAGCSSEAIVSAMGLRASDLFAPKQEPPRGQKRVVATYPYQDEAGNVLYEVVRFAPKDFRQRRPDSRGAWIWTLDGVRRVIYRLPQVLEAAKAGAVVYVVEGEKDVHSLERLGVVATTSPQGAGKWEPECSAAFHGCKGVVVLPDNDEPGNRHAQAVAASINAAGIPVKVVCLPLLPPKGDVTDWIAAGGTKVALLELTKATSRWEPPVAPANGEHSAHSALTARRTDERAIPVREWPEPPSDEVYHGVFGELVSVLSPHTESDPVAVLAQALVMFGNVIGRGPYYLAESDRHHGNLSAVLVGQSAKGRKGTSHGRVSAVFRQIDSPWLADRVKGGLSSGEGLICEVRDPSNASDGEGGGRGGDPGVTDKRLLLVEPEFASVLRVMVRDGNTLSAIIRQGWDTGKLNTLVKHSPTNATGAHISLIGHVTADELRRYLDRTEAGNGFANRILWLCVRRSKVLPFGGSLRDEDLLDVVADIRQSVDNARALGEARVFFDPEARALWAEVYEGLSEGRPGMLGAVTSRAEAQTVRLALLYALADCSRVIALPHLRAALAFWTYAEASAGYVFGDALGDPLADDILHLLRHAGDEGVDREGIRNALGRHRSSTEIGRALGVLDAAGLARFERKPTGGRPEERWYAVRGMREMRGKPFGRPLPPTLTALTAHTAQAGEPSHVVDEVRL